MIEEESIKILLNSQSTAIQKNKDQVKKNKSDTSGAKDEIEKLNKAIEEAPYSSIGGLQAQLDAKQKQLKNSPTSSVTASKDNLQMTASERAQILADAQQTVNDDAEKVIRGRITNT